MKKSQIDKLVFFLLLVWIIGIFAAPLIHVLPEAVGFLFLWKHSYSFVCHQQPDKCYTVAGESLSVCARCLGIYAGSLVGLLIAIVFPRIKRRVTGVTSILIFLVIMSGDVFLVLLGVYPYNKIRASVTGALVGFTLISYIYPEIRKFLLEKRNNDS